MAAINAYDEEVNFLFHDSVRPLVNERIISDCIRALLTYNAVDVAIPTTDTIIQVDDNNEIIMITTEGIIIRIGVDDISQLGRVTSGVKLMNLDSSKDIRIASIARVHEEEADEDETEEESSESEE